MNNNDTATNNDPQTGLMTTTTGTSVDYWPAWPTWPHNYIYVQPNLEPSYCIGKAHVFECEHVETCKCGAIKVKRAKSKGTR